MRYFLADNNGAIIKFGALGYEPNPSDYIVEMDPADYEERPEWIDVDQVAKTYSINNATKTSILAQEATNQSLQAGLDTVAKFRRAGEKIIDETVYQNQVDGIDYTQSKHLLSRVRDIFDLLKVGALNDARIDLQALSPDDFTQSQHWLTQARIDAIVNKIDVALGS